ncbi:MAG: hypothetical protein HY938_07890 [Nitrosomonadales bacterium]|nr:hypothetical protein [Nitrosomonadales bacterium]
MKLNANFIHIAGGIGLAMLSGWACADVALPDAALPTNAAIYTQNSKSYMLALNEGGVVIGQANAPATASAVQPAEYEPPFFSGSNAHKYMGLTTVALVGLTALTAPDDEGGTTKSRTQGTHQSLGRLTAAMAAATVTTGLLTHWDDFHLEDGWTDPDNLHVMLGTLGALAMLNAVSKAPGNGHPGSGIAGGVAMAAAIKLTW